MSLQLHVKNMTNDISLTIYCSYDITVNNLKQLIYDQNKDLPPYLFRLIYKSRELSNNEQFLNNIGLQNDDVLYFVMKLNLNPDKECLLYLKDKFNLDLNWSNELQFDQWERIRVLDNRVIQLNLVNLGLTCEIPTEICKLSNLRYLYLFNNQLRGKIPPEIGKLTNLQGLQLVNNQLTGEIPTEIGKLSNLELLLLSNNQLTGEIPTEMGKLINLRSLSLFNNNLSKNIPEEFKKLICIIKN